MIKFSDSKPLTLGVEVELQILDRDTFDLTPKISEVLSRVPWSHVHRIKPEIMEVMLEINTGICGSAQDVEKDLDSTYKLLQQIGEETKTCFASTGTHPFAHYSEKDIYPSARYRELIDRNQWIARRLMIFGVHVHIGMKSADHCISFNNLIMRYLPVLLALSSSSPYWHGEDTGLASCRVAIFESSPTAGFPYLFNTWNEFTQFIEMIIRAKSIRSIKDLWWDVRPSPGYGTLEIRICDGLASLADLTAIVAFIHALAHWLDSKIIEGHIVNPSKEWLYRDNKWRASRHGLKAVLIVDQEGNNKAIKDFALELLDQLKPHIHSLGYQHYIDHLTKNMMVKTSADRQREIFKKTGSLVEVSRFNSQEFLKRLQ